MSLETWQARYPTIVNEELQNLTLREAFAIRKEKEPGVYVWTARLSTGLFGRHDCLSGNKSYAPKGENDVLVAVGDSGLSKLIELGFIPCPDCHPEDRPDFWKKAGPAIKLKYPNLTDIRQFIDKNIVGYDTLAVNWETLAPYLKGLPNRLYVKPRMSKAELHEIKVRFEEKLGFELPAVGYYGKGFTEYIIK